MKTFLRSAIPVMLSIFIVTLGCAKTATLIETPATTSLESWYLTRGEQKSDQAWGVDVDSAGNVYIAGYFQSPASEAFYDIVVYKFDPKGNELWRAQWGDRYEQKSFVVAVDEPYIYVGGETRSSLSLVDSDMVLLCLNMADGSLVWDFEWGQGEGYEEIDGLVIEPDAIYVSGWTTSNTTGSDMAVLKLDKNGDLDYAQTWGTNGFDSADGQMVVDEQYLYVSGRINGSNLLAGGVAVLAKFNKSDGTYITHSEWGDSFFSDGLGTASDGANIYVVGLTITAGNGQIFLLKYDKELNLQWSQLWGGQKGESSRVAGIDQHGNILIAGSTFSFGNGGSDVVLIQYSPVGILNWHEYFGGPENDSLQGMVIAGSTVYLVGSTMNNSQGMNDALLIKAGDEDGLMPVYSSP